MLGFPKNLNNSLGERARKTLEFQEMLEKRTQLPVLLWDERLTTVSAQKSMIASNMNRKKRHQMVDAMAAVIILQSYLDSLK